MIKTSLPALALLLLSSPPGSPAQPDRHRLTKEDYIAKYRDAAIADMMRSGVPASITLAQGILESEFGNSFLAREANNHFGIKCHSDWTGERIFQDDDHRGECFRKYATAEESFADHSNFLRTRDRYAFLFDLRISDYKGWAHGLKKAGYATNPQYADRLIRIIEEFDLNKFDRMGTALPVARDGKAAPPPPAPSKKQRRPPPPPPARYEMSANQVPFARARSGDTYYSLAVANNIEIWQVLKYNDADKYDTPAEGDIVYVKPKRNKAQQETHVVAEGESLRAISQRYAVKLKKLYKYNGLKPGQEPAAGAVVKLR
jgi:LysM repeat protein